MSASALGSSRARALVATMLAVWLVAMPASGQPSQQPDQIELHKAFLKGLRFTLGDSEKKPVYTFTGMSFTPEFQNAIGRFPPALREARRAFPYNALSLAGSMGILVISTKNLIDTVNKANKVSNGELVDDSFRVSDLVPITVAAGVTVVGALGGKSHLDKGVRMFNARTTDLPEGGGIKGGVRVGINSATVDFASEGSSVDRRTGFSGGGFLRFPIGRGLSIQPELSLSQKGYRQPATTGDGNEIPGGAFDLAYLEMPVLLRIAPLASRLEPHVYAGPSFGVKVDEAFVSDGQVMEDYAATVKTTEVSLVLGGGIRIGHSPFIAGLRYSRSLSSIYEEPDFGGYYPKTGESLESEPDWKNSVITLEVEYSR